MSIQRWHINKFLGAAKGQLLIDVRSPAEYHHAHIPEAVNIPLFTDEERKIVGTAYKQQSREQAIKIGLDFFGPKMKKIVEQVEALIGNRQTAPGKDLFLYCWRGGMRSGAIAWLLNLYGFKVHLLAGGYKAYRNYVLQSFEQKFSLKVLGGFTGSGKTEILRELEKNGQPIINLEEIASHKGSAFGSYNMPAQPTQEMFENLLSTALRSLSEWSEASVPDENDLLTQYSYPDHHSPITIWLEDESQRIGLVNIPQKFWETMRNSPIYFLEIPFEERLNHITAEYSGMPLGKLTEAIHRISKRLGGLNTKNTLAALEAGNHKECFRILLKYYDKHYLKALHNRERLPALLEMIPCTFVSVDNVHLLPAKHQTV